MTPCRQSGSCSPAGSTVPRSIRPMDNSVGPHRRLSPLRLSRRDARHRAPLPDACSSHEPDRPGIGVQGQHRCTCTSVTTRASASSSTDSRNLTEIGGQGSVGTDGRTMDPGGFWTQADYKDVVAYAAAHFMTVVPEVDSPGHNNAIIMSEYNDTANPLLNGHPQDINCSTNNPPPVELHRRRRVQRDVSRTARTASRSTTRSSPSSPRCRPSPYYHVGGDEVPSTLLTRTSTPSFINQRGPARHRPGQDGRWAGPNGRARARTPARGRSPSTGTRPPAPARTPSPRTKPWPRT